MMCIHRWLLGQPKDGVSHGVCRKCGEQRYFRPTYRTDGRTGLLKEEQYVRVA